MKRIIFGMFLGSALALSLGAPLAASQAVDDELARYREQSDKADRVYQDGLAKERARTITSLSAAAKRAAKSEPASADGLWKLVLQLDDMNSDAREHFTATGAPIVPVFIERNGFRHHVIVERAIEMDDTGNKEQDILSNTQKWVSVQEKHVRRRPELWAWNHKRWKTEPKTA